MQSIQEKQDNIYDQSLKTIIEDTQEYLTTTDNNALQFSLSRSDIITKLDAKPPKNMIRDSIF